MGKKIFIVDDDQNLLRLLQAAFKSKGYEVDVAASGAEAMQYLKDESKVNALSLLVLDRMLPDSDGTELLKVFNEKCAGRIPVIILSALSSEKDVMEGLSKGARDYLTKPFNADVLLHKAQQMIK